jgi:hypothetical protein
MNDDEMSDLVMGEFVTAKQMVVLAVGIWAVIQFIAMVLQPTEWRNWQLLGFIASTNLAAVILAILAQRSADSISKTYKTVFTPDFYRAVKSISLMQTHVIAEAEKRGHSLEEEMEDIAPKLYGLFRQYVEVKGQEITPPDPEVAAPPEDYTEDELFGTS